MSTYNRKDRLYQQAKSEGYRSRASYKLIEIDKKFKILKNGFTVIDLGCFPGGWLQVSLERVGAKGKVIGIDLKDVDPLTVKVGQLPVVAEIIKGDIESEESLSQIKELCDGRAHVVLSDLSPPLSGISFRDTHYSCELVRMAFEFTGKILSQNGSFVAKIFPSPEADELAEYIAKYFNNFTRENLKSTRTSSNEYYFVGRGFDRQKYISELDQEEVELSPLWTPFDKKK